MNTRKGLAGRNVLICGAILGAWTAIALPETKFMASDGSAYDYFGSSAAVHGDTAVVGAYADDDKGANAGSAYVFERVGGVWTQTAKLIAADGTNSDYFGCAVGVSGNTIVVGAYGDGDKGTYSGSAYVFERAGGVWTQKSKLLAGDGAANNYFGYSVGIDGDGIVVGAYGNYGKVAGSGSAYVFERVGGVWKQTAKLIAADGANSDCFGCAVGISVDTIVAGAYRDGDKGAWSGSAYVFERASGVWTQKAKLVASDGSTNDCLGHAVAISGQSIVVGAHQDDDKGADSGSAYMFERIGGVWGQTAKLTAGDGMASDAFGYSVAILGSNAVIGAYGDDDGGSSAGSAYVAQKIGSGWKPVTKLTASDAAASASLGYSVAISWSNAVCGAYYATCGEPGCGAAYAYEVGNIQNTAPAASNQILSVHPLGEVYIDLAFRDPDGQAMTVRILSLPTNGTLQSYAARYGTTEYPGRYFYAWDAPFDSDSFTWDVNDGVATSGVATCTIVRNDGSGVVTGSDWPQWRGPNRDGVSPEKGWLRSWPPKELWRRSIGAGLSSVVVDNGRLYVTGCTVNQILTYCFDAGTGAQIWSRGYACTITPGAISGPGPTPAVAGNEVYTFDGVGNLYCFDKMTGTVLWNRQVDLGMTYCYGYNASPLVEGNLVILNASGRGAAVDRNAPHSIVWPITPQGSAGFPSPVGYSLGGQRFTALATEMAILGVNAGSGDIAWSYPLGDIRRGQDPIVYGDNLLFSKAAGNWVCLRPGPASAETVWTNASLRGADSGSGVLWKDHVYTPTSHGGMMCFDARNGAQKWLRMMPEAYHDGPLIASDGKLIVYWGCKLLVLKATPDGYDEEGRVPVDVVQPWTHGWLESAHATPALAHGRIYVRQYDVVVCYQVGADAPTDTNSNGIADSWEVAHLGATTNCAAAGDPDGDRFSNLCEYVAGTDPTNGASNLKVAISESNGNMMVCAPMLQAQGVGYEYKQRFYGIEFATDLVSGVWQGVPGWTNVPAGNSILTFTNDVPDRARFYRVKARLQ